MTAPTSGRQLMRQVVELIDELITIDLNVVEEPGALSVAAMSAPKILELLQTAEGLVDEVATTYGSISPHADGPTESEPEQAGHPPTRQIADLAFVGRGEIMDSRTHLQSCLATGNPLRIVTAAGNALRRLANVLRPLEISLAAFEGVKPPARVSWDLEIALATRKLYARLRRELRLVGQPGDSGFLKCLSRFIAIVGELRTTDVYRFLRFEDRVQITTLLKRTQHWLDQADERDPTEGRKLWEDLMTLVELLRLVNNRPELREHDRRQVARIWQVLFEGPRQPTTIPTPLKEDLETLVGLDSELDDLIHHAGKHPIADWRPCLSRLRANIQTTKGQG